MNTEHLSRIKKAELLSSVGAGVLGGSVVLVLLAGAGCITGFHPHSAILNPNAKHNRR